MFHYSVGKILRAWIYLVALLVVSPAFGQITNRFAFPALAGMRFREANVTAGTNDSGNSPLFGVPDNFYDQDYYWQNPAGPSGDEWDHWIVPQILAAKAAGANCIRLMWSADAFVGDANHHGAANWVGVNTWSGLTNEIGMVASLCLSNGMWLYPTCTDSRVIQDGNLPTNQVYAYLSNFVACASTYDNVVAIDVVQEADGAVGSTNSVAARDCSLWIRAARDGLKRAVPLTCSLNGAGNSGDMNLGSRWQCYNLAQAGVDYFDCHAYFQYSVADWFQTVTNPWGMPVVFGETGISMAGVWGSGVDNESVHPYSSEKITDFYFAAQAAAELPYFQMTGIWAVAPNVETNEEDFGLYSGAQNATYQFTDLRERWRNFVQFPTNILPANYTWSVVSTGVDTVATDYSAYTRYAIQSGMEEADGSPIWRRSGNKLQAPGNTGAVVYGDGQQLLYLTALPPALGETVQFDVPPQDPLLYIGRFCTWEAFVRGQPNSTYYLISLVRDTQGQFDNKIEISSVLQGALTSLTNVNYETITPLSLTNWWRLTVNVSTDIYPTTITCTLSNLTTGVAMTPSLVCTDATPVLQHAGGMGLCGYLGWPYYTNVNFQAVFDTAPTTADPPVASASGANVTISWQPAQMGSGTIRYVPQYVESDRFGFPAAMTWTNGVATTAFSETITGLPANTNLILRVMCFDATGSTNYSSWRTVATGAGVTPGALALQLDWPIGGLAVVETTTNLVAGNWSPIQTNSATGGKVNFTDTNWQGYASRYYRLRSP